VIFPVGTHAECGAKIKLSKFIKIIFKDQRDTSCNEIKCAHFVLRAQSLLETLNFFTSTMFDILNVACYALDLFPGGKLNIVVGFQI
jgi:hypothetical protein